LDHFSSPENSSRSTLSETAVCDKCFFGPGLSTLRKLRYALCAADGGYTGTVIEWLWRSRSQRRIRLEIVKHLTNQRGFQIVPKRWIVERTFGWRMKYRRLRCDYATTHSHQ
jgi:transposase